MHIRELNSIDLDLFDFSEVGPYAKEVVTKAVKTGGVFSVFHNGAIVAVGGIIKYWHGVGEMWCLTSKDMEGKWAKWPFLHRQAKRLIQVFFNEMEGHRLQTSILSGFEGGQKWAGRLGFHSEGDMPQYGPDRKDYERWALVKGS